MQKRFLFVASLIFALSIYSAVRENIFIGFLAAGILLSEIFYIIFSKLDKNKKLFLCSFIGMFLLLGILVGQRVVRRNENIEKVYFNNKFITFFSDIENIKQVENQIIISTNNINIIGKYQKRNPFKLEKKLKIKRIRVILFDTGDKRIFSVGDRIQVKGKIKSPKESLNPGEFNQKNYLLSNEIDFTVNARSIILIEKRKYSIKKEIEKIRKRIKEGFKKNLPKEEAYLLSFMCIGKSDIENNRNFFDTSNELFRLSGIISLLAISGTHISVVSYFLYKILLKRKKKYILYGFLSAFISVLYSFICNNPISSIRAIIMFFIMVISSMIGENYDAIVSLSIAMIAVLFLHPIYILNQGFILSFGITFIVLYGIKKDNYDNMYFKNVRVDTKENLIKDKIKMRIKKLKNSLISCFVISVFSSVIISSLYYEVPLYSFLTNFIILPLFPPLLLLGLTAGIFIAVGDVFISKILLNICHIFLYFYEWFSDKITILPFSNVIKGNINLLILVIIFILFLILFSEERKKTVLKYLLTFSVFIYILIPKLRKNEVIKLNLPKGQGAYECHENKTIFIDGGSKKSGIRIDSEGNIKSKVGDKIVVPFLMYKGVRKIDEWIITDSSYLEGLFSSLKKGVNVGKIITSKNIGKSDEFIIIKELAKLNGTKIVFIKE